MYMQAHSIGGRGRGQGGPSLPPLFLAGIFFLKFTYKRPISLKLRSQEYHSPYKNLFRSLIYAFN